MLGLHHKNVNTRIVQSYKPLDNYKSIINGVLYSWNKQKWCAPPMRYYGN